jgi:Flp pilus assembly pilin Flp
VLLGRGGGSRYFTMIRRRTTARSIDIRSGGAIDWGHTVIKAMRHLWAEENGQDVAEYAVMLAVILVIVIGTVRLIGGNANNVFSQVGSQMSN